jgi:excinuclease ABC subunit B
VAPEKSKKYSYSDVAGSIFGVEEESALYGSVSKKNLSEEEMQELIFELESEMLEAAEKMEYERAASLRERIKKFSADRFVK